MSTSRKLPRSIGKPIKRREDPSLLTGRGNYVADIPLPDAVSLTFVRSPFPHANIRSIDSAPAESMPGVVGIFTADVLHPELKEPLPASLNVGDGELTDGFSPKRFPLAGQRARYVGDPVAVVAAESPYQGADAAEQVAVDYESLSPALDATKADAKDSSVLYPEHGTNRGFVWRNEGGDVERAFADAEVIVDVPFRIQRLIPSAMEPRTLACRYDSDSAQWTLWSSTQIPHLLRNDLAKMLGVDRDAVRVIAPEVGGGFGAKSNVYPEQVVAALVARRLHRPVRWAATRSEDFVSTSHGRDQTNRLRLAATREGRITGADLEVIYDTGAYYTRSGGPSIAPLTGVMMTGVYDIENARCRAQGVFSNKVPNEPYRGAGRPEAAFMIERAVDVLARKLKTDPVALREKNFIPPDQFPHRTATHVTYDSGNYAGALNACLRRVGYKKLRREQAQRRREGGFPLGIGIACYVEICGFGPWEAGSVQVDRHGKVRVLTGTSPHGQGHQTSWAQIASEILQIPSRDITVIHGDTAIVPRGIGTFGSRSTPVGGTAVFNNSGHVVEQAKAIAGHLLEASASDVRLSGGKFHVVGLPSRTLSWQAIAEAVHDPELSDKFGGKLSSDEDYKPSGETYPFGTHACVVEIDPETGEVQILRFVTVDDCGRVINPLLATGQVHGGIAQGIGQALFEEAVYDESGSLITGSLLEYAVPRADRLPTFETHRTETPTPLNPLGAKGIGEAATIGSTPAVVNAVVDALAPWGVTHIDPPLKPEKLWRLMNNRGSR